MASLMPDSGFVRTWWLYAVGIYFIWCRLAGVGFVLALAFLGDAGPELTDYLRAVGYVALVLFVSPLPAVMALAAIVAVVHSVIARIVRGRRSEPDVVPLAAVCPGIEPEPEADHGRPPVGGFRTLILIGLRVLAAASIACGVFIVATKAPQEVARNGLGPAIITSLIFLVPLVFVPLAFLFSGSRVGMPEQGNAADSR